MTISSDDIRRIRSTMNGSNDTVTVTFKFYDDTDLLVYITDTSGVETLQVLGDDYTVTGGDGSTGTVVFTTAPTLNYIVTITSDIPTLQESDYVRDNALDPEVLETNLDRLTLIIQDREERINRSILASAASGISGLEIKDQVEGNLLIWDADGNISSADPDDLNIVVTENPVAGSDITVTQSSHGLVVGDLIYHTGSLYAKAKADSASTSEVVGMVAVVTNSNTFTFVTSGNVNGLTGLTAGANYFLSAATAGAMTTTEPSVSNIVVPVAIATSTTSAVVRIQRGNIAGTAVTAASTSNMSTGTSTSTYVTPSVFNSHKGSAKAWGTISVSGGTHSLLNGYNVSVADGGAGVSTITFTTQLSNANFAVVYGLGQATVLIPTTSSKATTGFTITTRNTSSTATDASGTAVIDFVVFGE